MRKIDPRSRFSRRRVLGAGVAVPAVAATLGARTDAWAEGGTLQPATMKTLAKIARDMYPHDFLGDSVYVTAVKPWNEAAAKDPAVRAMIEDGVHRLDEMAQDCHKVRYLDVAWEAQRVALLQAMEESAFFKAVRKDLPVTIYNQHEIWPKFGYEGASADKGGYLHRGFNDIDWLPKA